MKNSNMRKKLFHSFLSRFLMGLIIALGLSLTAFEWTSISTVRIDDWEYEFDDNTEIILPPITYRTEALEIPEPKKAETSDQIEIVKDYNEKEIITEEAMIEEVKAEPILNYIDPNVYFEPEIIIEDNLPRTVVEVFAHYNSCFEFYGKELMECSKLDIQNRVKQNFKVTPQLRMVGGRQGAEIEIVVDENGEISSIQVLQSSSKAMSKAAVKAVEKLTKMNPAQQHGRKVALRMKIPIQLWIRN